MNSPTVTKFLLVARQKGVLALGLSLYMLGLGEARAATFTTIDAPCAGTNPTQGTVAFGINPERTIVGFCRDANDVRHGFVRARDGTITTFDVPGAGTAPFQGTRAYSINPAGAITGFYTDVNNTNRGYLRAPDGSFSTFDAPGAGGNLGTIATNINPVGGVTGTSTDVNNVFHGFVRALDGTITVSDAPGAGTAGGQGTFTAFTSGLNPAGATTGYYLDANNVFHGYVHNPDGTFITFDAPGAGTGAGSFQGTFAAGLNQAGAITGDYLDANNVFHGYVRNPDGTFITFDAPGAGTGAGSFQGTFPQSINAAKAISGAYTDASGVNHGFLRAPGGAITTFDVPGSGTGAGQGTFPDQNNSAGAIVGFYVDANGVNHGFVRSR